MVILDTNVLSALMQDEPDRAVTSWLNGQSRISIWTTSVTIMELSFGIQILPAGKKRSHLTQLFEILLSEKVGGRVASFDRVAAQHTADLMASRYRSGRPVELRDTMIAGIAIANHATIATRNTPHFRDLSVPVVDPWSP
jgi:predicted nucleic acid-binding protein